MNKTLALALLLPSFVLTSTGVQAHKAYGYHHHKQHVVVVKPKPHRNAVVVRHHRRSHHYHRPMRPGRALSHAVADAIWWNATR